MNKLIISKDWRNIDKILLVFPSMRTNLINEFIQFVYLLNTTCKEKQIIIIIPNEEDKEKFESLLKRIYFENNNLLPNLFNINYWYIETNDIWIRDFNFINVIEKKTSKSKFIKFLYDPSYGYNTSIDNNIGMKALNKFSKEEQINSLLPLKLDGGNIISNEKYALISNKLFSENYDFSKKEIESIFEKIFETKLITFNTDPLDIIGHADSAVRFLDEKTILLPIYDDSFTVENRYVNELYKKLSSIFPIDTNFIFIPCSLSDNISEESIPSAEYCYLNYLRIENSLYFPSFEGQEQNEKEIKRILHRYNQDLNIYFSKCDNIAKEGGCFNCISSVVFK